jgi:predicted HTH domain antitoxin
MAISITIPDDVLESAKIPRSELKQELLKEMAFALYSRGITSMGTARKLAKIDKWKFLEGLAARGIERHYNEAELKEDIAYANSHK